MVRRLHTPLLRPGEIPLDPAQARHARAALRLPDGSPVEAFDDAGNVASATLVFTGPQGALLRIEGDITLRAQPPAGSLRWSVASAVPKGERADWMVEKLSELGAAAFIPLRAARSVVLPQGRGKHERWARIATESAKQSRRAGVMRIEPLTSLNDIVRATPAQAFAGWQLSTPGAVPIGKAVAGLGGVSSLTLLIGPEGGWTAEESAAMAAGFLPVRLTATVLRVETAAVAAAAVVAALMDGCIVPRGSGTGVEEMPNAER